MGSDVSESKSLDFSEFWIGSGVEREVLRGAKLRDEKHKNIQKQKQFIPVDFNINRSVMCLNNDAKIRRKRKHKAGSSSKKYSKCPMRIAELAIPSKRQCLDTWRHRGRTLPNFMVDRLRKHVTDQKAVVQIDDALKCFKSCNLKKSRQSKINTSKRKRKKVDKTNKLFCCLIGHKLAWKLMPPGRIPIPTTSLIKMSRIINEDIGQLVHRRNVKDQKIQMEISEKLAVWIATILQESEVKLMIDDLKDFEEREGFIWDIIDDLIDVISERCKSENLSNKEEEYVSKTNSLISIESNKSIKLYNKRDSTSHSDEFIDILESKIKANKIEIIDNILADIIDTVCQQYISIEALIQNYIGDIISKAISEATSDIVTIDEITNITTFEDFLPETKDVENIVFESESKAEIKDILTNSNIMDQFDNENTDFAMIRIQSIDSPVKEPSIVLDDIQNNETPELVNALDQLQESTKTQYIENASDENGNPENTQNDTDASNFQETDNEESLDDFLKKVKFSDINIGNKLISIADDKYRYNEDDTIIYHQKRLPRNYIKHNNHFSTENTHFCNVDETWPDDCLPLTNKLSASVSKSVISLGLIMETDEKVNHSTNSDILKESSENNEEKIVAALCQLPEPKKSEIKETILLDIPNLNESIQSNVVKIHKILDESRDDNNLEVTSSPIISLHNEKNPCHKDASTSQMKLNLKAENLTSLNIDSEITVSSKKPSKEKQMQTQKTKPIKPNFKPLLIRQQKLRIWCEGLGNVIINLEKWLKWINYTQTVVSQLKKNDKPLRERGTSINDWLQLKKSIDSDAQLWFHLYQSLLIGMNSYKNYYIKEMIKSLQPNPCVCNTGL